MNECVTWHSSWSVWRKSCCVVANKIKQHKNATHQWWETRALYMLACCALSPSSHPSLVQEGKMVTRASTQNMNKTSNIRQNKLNSCFEMPWKKRSDWMATASAMDTQRYSISLGSPHCVVVQIFFSLATTTIWKAKTVQTKLNFLCNERWKHVFGTHMTHMSTSCSFWRSMPYQHVCIRNPLICAGIYSIKWLCHFRAFWHSH